VFSEKRYLVVGLCCCFMATLLYLFADAPIAWFFHYNTTPPLREVAERVTHAGDSLWTLAPSLILWIGLWKFRRRDARRAMFMFLSVACSGLIGIAFKVLMSRARPPLLFDKGEFGFAPFTFATDFLHNSFPSGHAATAMSAATVFALLFPTLRIPFYLMGIMICSTRVIVGVHYASDIVMGGLLGWLTADILYKRLYSSKTATRH